MQRVRSGAPHPAGFPSHRKGGGRFRSLRPVSVALLALALTVPGRLAAQNDGARTAEAVLGAAAGLTSIRGRPAGFGGGSALLDLGLPVRFGGSGWILLSSRSVPGGADHYELRMAYGGLLLESPLWSRNRATIALRTLVGVGNAKVTLPVVATPIGADNFGVVEPALQGALQLVGALAVTVEGSYRAVFGVEDLPSVGAPDLRGPSVRVGLSLGGR